MTRNRLPLLAALLLLLRRSDEDRAVVLLSELQCHGGCAFVAGRKCRCILLHPEIAPRVCGARLNVVLFRHEPFSSERKALILPRRMRCGRTRSITRTSGGRLHRWCVLTHLSDLSVGRSEWRHAPAGGSDRLTLVEQAVDQGRIAAIAQTGARGPRRCVRGSLQLAVARRIRPRLRRCAERGEQRNRGG